jgi:hypothetical protein
MCVEVLSGQQEIRSTTSIPEQELRRHLQSLACAKYKILKKHPPGRDVNPEDSFSFNHGFVCPMQRIKISTVSAKVESTEERKETRDRIDEERQYQTEVRGLVLRYIIWLQPVLGLHRPSNEGPKTDGPQRSHQ